MLASCGLYYALIRDDFCAKMLAAMGWQKGEALGKAEARGAVVVGERGELREGWHGDVVLFDPTRVLNHAPELVQDLPGGNARLVTRAEGIEAVIVNGAVSVERGELTGQRRGQVIRGA